MNNKQNILIVGTGAVGGFYGGKLSQAGASVSTLCRSDYDAVKKNGIVIKSINGDFVFHPDEIVRTVAEYGSTPDYILVATKILPEIDVPALIKDKVTPETAIILLQNGIGMDEPVQRAFPDNEIISGLAFICVSRTGMGEIHHQDFGRIVLGLYPSGRSEKVAVLNDLFNAVGVPCTISEDVIAARWNKLIWNAPFNPISVLTGGADTCAVLNSAPTLELAVKVMEEVAAIARATGHPLPDDVIKRNIDLTDSMKPFKTSMLQDFESSRPMEVEAILGNALRIARDHNVPAPHIESLYGLLSLINKRFIKKG